MLAKAWSFSFSISPSNEYSGLISFGMDRFDFLDVQGTLKSLLQHHSSKASILVKNLPCYCRRHKRCRFDPWIRKIPWGREWQPTPVFLPRESHGQRSLVRCSPWGHGELDTTEQLHFHFSLSCIGEGNGNPLQCSCLENSLDRGAWWASVHGVKKSWTQLSDLAHTQIKV